MRREVVRSRKKLGHGEMSKPQRSEVVPEVVPEVISEEDMAVATTSSSGCGACGDPYWRRWSDIPCAPVAGMYTRSVGACAALPPAYVVYPPVLPSVHCHAHHPAHYPAYYPACPPSAAYHPPHYYRNMYPPIPLHYTQYAPRNDCTPRCHV